MADNEPDKTPAKKKTKKKTTRAETKRLNAHERCNLVAERVNFVAKDGQVTIRTGSSSFTYQAVTHDAVTRAIRDVMVDVGLTPKFNIIKHSFVESKNMTVVELVVSFHCVDDPSDFISHTVIGYGQDFGDKGPGKAFSYAVKNLYLKAFMLETGEDDEERIPDTGSGPVSDATREELENLMDETGTNEADVIKFVNNANGLEIKKISQLPKKFVPQIRAMLKKKQKKLQNNV